MKIITYRRWKLFWQLAMEWFKDQFSSLASSIDFTEVEAKIDDVKSDVADVKTAVQNIDFTPLAKEAQATLNKEAIITAVNNAQPDLSSVAKQGTNPNATNTAILAAFGNIDFSTLAKQGSNANATLTAILEALQGGDDPSPDIPEGVAERLAMILEHFGIKTISGYSFGTPTEIIDELKDIMGAIDQEATLPNSVTIDGTTYSGTSNS